MFYTFILCLPGGEGLDMFPSVSCIFLCLLLPDYSVLSKIYITFSHQLLLIKLGVVLLELKSTIADPYSSGNYLFVIISLLYGLALLRCLQGYQGPTVH